ncbi:MAG TPA: hypothetical protein VHK86_03015 [Nitrososphaera sp.]|jgi:hypothetical protein|nr:hypothetical protein [Nitrososphaera sp.]HEX2614818.1 hypothetical protein [Nitrososphaera sp.]
MNDNADFEEMSLNEILDALEKSGVNVSQLRKAYGRRRYIDSESLDNLLKLYRAHVAHGAYKDRGLS